MEGNSPSRTRIVRDLAVRGAGLEEIANVLGLSVEQVHAELVNTANVPEPLRFEHEAAASRKLSLDEHFEEAIRRQEYERRASDTRIVDAVYPTFDENKPIAVAHLSDIHIGSSGVDYQTLRHHLKIVRETPGMYSVFMGDELNNFILGRMAAISRHDVIQPQTQWKFVETMMEYAAPKTLAMLRGNHNNWTIAAAGLDPQGRFMSAIRMLDIGHGGSIFLRLPAKEPGRYVQYHLYLRHKYQYESTLNPFNAVWRMHDFFGPFDVGSIGHTHTKGISETRKQEKSVIAIRPGSYKVYDEFGDSLGFPQAVAHAPTVIYFPGEKRMMPFADIEEAAKYLTYLRTQDPRYSK